MTHLTQKEIIEKLLVWLDSNRMEYTQDGNTIIIPYRDGTKRIHVDEYGAVGIRYIAEFGGIEIWNSVKPETLPEIFESL